MSETLPQRGEIWWVDFEPATGSEPSKTRPAIVISVDAFSRLPTRIVVPLTSWQPKHEEHENKLFVRRTRENGLRSDSAADLALLRVVALDRFRTRAGALPRRDVAELAAAVAFMVGHIA